MSSEPERQQIIRIRAWSVRLRSNFQLTQLGPAVGDTLGPTYADNAHGSYHSASYPSHERAYPDCACHGCDGSKFESQYVWPVILAL